MRNDQLTQRGQRSDCLTHVRGKYSTARNDRLTTRGKRNDHLTHGKGKYSKRNDLLAQHGKRDDSLTHAKGCLLYTSPSPRDISGSRMPSSA